MSTSAPVALDYLTVQDVLWINLQLTKRSNPFDFAKLEEATFMQYSYGASADVVAQAAAFLKGFIRKAPFGGHADTETAFVAGLSFLLLNGLDLTIPAGEARSWLARVASEQIDVAQAIQQLAKPTASHFADSRECMSAILATYAARLTEASSEEKKSAS